MKITHFVYIIFVSKHSVVQQSIKTNKIKFKSLSPGLEKIGKSGSSLQQNFVILTEKNKEIHKGYTEGKFGESGEKF